MEYQEKLIILPPVQDMEKDLTITVYEAVGTGLCYHAVGGQEKDGFVITHLASKKALCHPVSTKHEIKLVLEKVAKIVDWTQSEKKLIKPWIGAEFLKCQQTVKQELNMDLETGMNASNMPDYLVEYVLEDMEEHPTIRTVLLYAFKIVC